ncbi:MAG: VOC family protein [Chlamydiales bacterium]
MEKGTICWFAIAAGDLKQSRSFYEALFGWEFEERDNTLIIHNNKAAIGQINQSKEKGDSEHGPLIYIAVVNVDKTLEKAKKIGAVVTKERTELPREEGFYAHLKDPDGNTIGIWSY